MPISAMYLNRPRKNNLYKNIKRHKGGGVKLIKRTVYRIQVVKNKSKKNVVSNNPVCRCRFWINKEFIFLVPSIMCCTFDWNYAYLITLYKNFPRDIQKIWIREQSVRGKLPFLTQFASKQL